MEATSKGAELFAAVSKGNGFIATLHSSSLKRFGLRQAGGIIFVARESWILASLPISSLAEHGFHHQYFSFASNCVTSRPMCIIARIGPFFKRDYDACTSDGRKADRRMLDSCDEREASRGKTVRLAYRKGVLDNEVQQDSGRGGSRCFPVRIFRA